MVMRLAPGVLSRLQGSTVVNQRLAGGLDEIVGIRNAHEGLQCCSARAIVCRCYVVETTEAASSPKFRSPMNSLAACLASFSRHRLILAVRCSARRGRTVVAGPGTATAAPQHGARAWHGTVAARRGNLSVLGRSDVAAA